jgi:hypothetical protein
MGQPGSQAGFRLFSKKAFLQQAASCWMFSFADHSADDIRPGHRPIILVFYSAKSIVIDYQ